MTRQRIEILAVVLAAGGAAFALQQATSVPGTWLMMGVYIAIAGLIVLVIGARRGDRTAITLPARVVVGASMVVALGLAVLGIVLCGPTLLINDCRA
jgi:hypothetical protein